MREAISEAIPIEAKIAWLIFCTISHIVIAYSSIAAAIYMTISFVQRIILSIWPIYATITGAGY